ncbi:MAG: tetratricopeptide repeat protein [Bacteroidia bacterium]
MNKFLIFLLFGTFCLLSACGDNRTEALEKIKDVEKKLLDAQGMPKDDQSAYNLQVLYDDFAVRFPEDPKAPEYLFKTAEIGMNIKGGGESNVKVLEKFLSMFPNDKRAPDALFLLGYVYDNQINNDAKAKEYYTSFLKKYPKHPYCKDAEMSIKNLGKTDEELIREFEKMNADSALKNSTKSNP